MKGPATVKNKSEGSRHQRVIRKSIVAAISVALASGVVIGSASYAATRPTDAYFKWAQKSARVSLASDRTADAARWEAQAEKAYFRVRNSPREALARGRTNDTEPDADIYISNRGGQQP